MEAHCEKGTKETDYLLTAIKTISCAYFSSKKNLEIFETKAEEKVQQCA